MQVLQQIDPTGQTIFARVPSVGTVAMQPGSQLIVEEAQQVVLLSGGKALDTFGPGRHTLEIGALPLLSEFLGLASDGGSSPFRAAAAFVSTGTFADIKWGTREPMVYQDREFDEVRLRAFGELTLRIADVGLFVEEMVETEGLLDTAAVESFLKGVIVARLTEHLDETLGSVLELPAHYEELAAALAVRVGSDFAARGLEIVDLCVGAITPPSAVRKRIGAGGGPTPSRPDAP